MNYFFGIVTLQNLDTMDNTPVLDLKPYEKFCDYVKDSMIPKYLDFFENAE
ncbi:MAG: TrmO family methyltransferase [Promethearchaeota archaeon]